MAVSLLSSLLIFGMLSNDHGGDPKGAGLLPQGGGQCTTSGTPTVPWQTQTSGVKQFLVTTDAKELQAL